MQTNIIYNISILRNAKAVNHLVNLRFCRTVLTVCLAAPDLQECRQEAAPPLLHWDTALVGQGRPHLPLGFPQHIEPGLVILIIII